MARQTRRVELRKRARLGSLKSAREERTAITTLKADTRREAWSLSTAAPASSKIVTE